MTAVPPAPARFGTESVERLVRPRSVAILGVSGKPEALTRPGGRLLMQYLVRHGFDGPIYPVNPRLRSIDEHAVFPDLASIGEPIDCAVVALPARLVPDAVAQCGVAGIGQALLLGAGFGELGDEGRLLEERTLALAREQGVRLLGPNSAGLVNVAGSVALSMTSVLGGGGALPRGRVSLVLQSGAMGSALLDRMRVAGAGISYMVSLGNQIDLDAADFLAHCAADEATGAVCLYLESLTEGSRFREAVQMVRDAGKRVFVLLAGRSDLGERAAVTHTGRITGRRRLEEALLAASGATPVEDVDTLWKVAHLAASGPAGGDVARVGILTISGGLSVLASDALGMAGGFEMPPPGEETVRALAGLVPDYAELTNPLDLGSGTMPHAFPPALLTFGGDPAFDAVAIVMPVVAPWWQEVVAEGIVRGAADLGKPVVVCWCAGETNRAAFDILRSSGVSVVETPDGLARLLAAYRRPTGAFVPPVAPAPSLPVPPPTSGLHVLRALSEAGADVPEMEVVASVDEALAAAERIGWPVALKALGAAHKTELGLARPGVTGPDDLRSAFHALGESARDAGWQAGDVLVQGMADPGVELVLTIRRDPDLGAFVGVGVGGILVELFRGIVFAPLPITHGDLVDLVAGIPGHELLFGYRGSAPIDLEWVHRAIGCMSEVAEERSAQELEVNPAIVWAGGGAIVDALLVPAPG